jgi:hypothetical protein
MMWFKPNTDFQYELRGANGLLEFFLFLNQAISEFHTFRIDIKRYRPTLATEAEQESPAASNAITTSV